jgi:RND family efflux transporter MFP subunit
MFFKAWLLCLSLVLWAAPAWAGQKFIVAPGLISDQKAVFATVEAAHVVLARTQLGGTVAMLNVQAGDTVGAGETIANVVDPGLAEQLHALDAEITGLTAQLAQAKMDDARDQALIRTGAIAQSTLDAGETAVNVADSGLKSRIAARAALAQQITDGAVLAPVSGRVLATSVTQGSVVLAGNCIATIASQNYVLRLDIPERHARFLHLGDPVRLDDGEGGAQFGRIVLIYPQIQNGLVEADATAPELGNYFVGSRIQVWMFAGTRPGLVIPARYIETLYGLDYVNLRNPDGSMIAVPVQRGEAQPTPALQDGIEILSGLHDGDVLVPPP